MGPDGNLWFTEQTPHSPRGPGYVGRITPAGEINEYLRDKTIERISGITAGPGGRIWFSGSWRGDAFVGSTDTSGGDLRTFPAAGGDHDNTEVGAITMGPDGNLWYSLPSGFGVRESPGVGRMTPSGEASVFAPGPWPDAIIPGPDGDVWATDRNRLFRVTPQGAFQRIADSRISPNGSLTLAADGRIWTTADPPGDLSQGSSDHNTYFARVDANANVTYACVPAAWGMTRPNVLAADPDGNVWVAGWESHSGASAADAFAVWRVSGDTPETCPETGGGGYTVPQGACGQFMGCPSPGGGSDPGASDTTPPVVSRLRARPAKFAVGPGPRRGARGTARGTTLSFQLSETARVTLSFERVLPGKRTGSGRHVACVAPSARNRRARPCSRFGLVGSVKQNGHAGSNALPFSGRVRGRPLTPGRYRVVAVAADAAGNRSPRSATTLIDVVR